jgi:hypothetical protein
MVHVPAASYGDGGRRLTMMTNEERAESFLRSHTGRSFCGACLAHALDLSAPDGRSVMWRLRSLPDYEMRGTKCTDCSRGKRTIRHIGRSTSAVSAKILDFLLEHAGIALCDACLAFAVDISLDDARRAVTVLARGETFARYEGICLVCSRRQPVICAMPRKGSSEAPDGTASASPVGSRGPGTRRRYP